MSVTDHPVSFYQHEDITDPTPYEEDNRIFPDECCAICGEDFFRGETVVLIDTPDMYYREFVHEVCYGQLFRNIGEQKRFEHIMDTLGFYISEAEEEEE